MKKNIKKTFLSLVIAGIILLSGSFTFASGFRYRTVYNYFSRYQNNGFYNYIVTYYPKYNTNNYTKPQDTSTKVTEEKPVDPEKPTENTNNNITNTVQSIELEVVKLVNEERKKVGLAPLNYNAELSKVARIKSQDMADNNYFSHNSPTYKDPFTMMKNFGISYRTAGENIAKGYSNAQSVMNGWMNSSGHRANILNPNFGTIGVGYVTKNGTTYWTQMFTD